MLHKLILFVFIGLTTTVAGSYSAGLIEDDPNLYLFYDFQELGETTAPGLPEQFDWRRVSNVLPEVEDQKDCGACVSFAMISALESSLNLACNRSFSLSKQFIFSCGGGSCKEGWRFSEAADFIKTYGVPDSACMPYIGNGDDIPCADACSDYQERSITHINIDQQTDGIIDVVKIKRALLKGPLVTNIILFKDLYDYEEGVYRHTSGEKTGSHAVVLVGWNDDDEAWIIRNSWGTEWGEDGYFEVAWDDESLPGRYTYLFDVSEAVKQGACSYRPEGI